MTGEELLRHHVANFNAGVHSGDWSTMVASFAPDATMEFVGIPAGPFHGRDAIAAAYMEQPPDDELVLLAVEDEEHEVARGRYAWASDPEVDAGALELVRDGDLIRRLVVHYEQ
jgi:steroid Delta-isomerase